MILAGDIGGTSTRLGLFAVEAGRLTPLVVERYESRRHDGLGAIVRAFRSAHPEWFEHACFGVAGPVIGARVEAPNLPWVVDALSLARDVGLREVGLINDLEANAHGIFALSPGDFLVLNADVRGAAGNAAIIAAGTGLGEAGMYFDGQCHHPFACEGGHADFAPNSDLETELLAYLRRNLGPHVSWERVVSGPGLVNIYEFLRDRDSGPEPAWLREALRGADRPAVISQAGLEGRSAPCARALDLFVSAYGAEAGNLALKIMATAGVYVGGGIAPKIAARLKDGAFMAAFTAKGRLSRLLERIPVRVILNEHTALLGAARSAALRASLARPAAL